MYKINYCIGCNDKATLKQELSNEFFISTLDSLFDNYILSQTQGRFTNKDGVKIFEKSFIVTIITNNDYETKDIFIKEKCDILKTKLNQESVLVTKELIRASFM